MQQIVVGMQVLAFSGSTVGRWTAISDQGWRDLGFLQMRLFGPRGPQYRLQLQFEFPDCEWEVAALHNALLLAVKVPSPIGGKDIFVVGACNLNCRR